MDYGQPARPVLKAEWLPVRCKPDCGGSVVIMAVLSDPPTGRIVTAFGACRVHEAELTAMIGQGAIPN